ncbi:hypothetical protein TNCV_1772451 [Trichonephila clavipes]|nr:hypothetical protein TNCV_1772451 [Trichonephila clavipes]
MAKNERITSSRQLAARWSTATDVRMSASSFRRCLLHHGLRDHDDIRVRRYAGERCLPECVIEQNSCLTPGVMANTCNFFLDHWPDMLPIEHVWDLGGRHFTRDLHPAVSKDELLLRILHHFSTVNKQKLHSDIVKK